MIFFHKHYHQEISLLEVSGPLEKINHAHYLEDRHKIAKNLKHILKSIIDSMPPSSAAAVKKLKIYGFHLYDDMFYIYSLSTPNLTNYIFCMEAAFKVPLTIATLRQNGPRFLAKLYTINDLIMDMDANLKEVYEESLQQSIISSDSEIESDLSPDCSPQKKKTKTSA